MFNQKSSLMQRIGFTVLFLLFYSFTPINAQESEDLMEMSLEDILNLTVVSASKQAEPLQEVPVPVTVITSEMIQNIGAKNLKDVLITYVPGITFSQDHNEINVAMRGVYASSQQKILIMLDGHRLNCRAYSEANPDYSISLDKIKQIEVLRGPGSS
ncbi:MAG: Plug domain-containing protein, partial [Calditrichales bacterium]|nr:Plug domain-containing protein [Calditrichales bacterium]